MYVFATALFFTRYYTDAIHYQAFVDAFIARGGEWDNSALQLMGILRISIYVVGSVFALIFLNVSAGDKTEPEVDD